MGLDSIGYWNTIAEAAKLTQSTLIPGVVEEDIYRNPPLEKIPVAQATGTGLSIKWLRQGTVDIDTVQDFTYDEELVWTKGGNYTVMETELKMCYKAIRLNQFVQDIHKTVNDYEEMAMQECENVVMRKLNMKLLYDDATYGSAKQFNGWHALAALNDVAAAEDGVYDYDMGEAGLSLWTLRKMLRVMKYGCDAVYLPGVIFDYIAAAYEEKGFAGLAYNSAGAYSQITRTTENIGEPIYKFAKVPFIDSDYLLGEQVNTGRGTTLRALWSSGTVGYSLFGVKFGSIMAGASKKVPGMCLAFGGTTGVGNFFKLKAYKDGDLPNFDGGGLRLINYSTPLLGSKLCLTRIHDVTAAAITV